MSQREFSDQLDDSPNQFAVDGQQFRIEQDLAESSTKQLGSRTQSQSTAREGENAFSQPLGRAFVDGAFHCLQYGLFEGRPACNICIDVSFDVGLGREIKELRLEMALGSERSRDENSTSLPDAVVFPKLTDCFGPKELYGPVREEKKFKRTVLNLKVETGFGGLATPSHETRSEWIREDRWSLKGFRQATDLDRSYRVAKWTLRGNKLSQDTMPRMIRLGVVVEHGSEPFDLTFRCSGSLKEGKRLWDLVRNKRPHRFQFVPPHKSLDVLDEEHVKSYWQSAYGTIEI